MLILFCEGGDGGTHGEGELWSGGVPQQLHARYCRAQEGGTHKGNTFTLVAMVVGLLLM